jgi:ferredoxin
VSGRVGAWANLGYRFARHMLVLPVRALRRGSAADRLLRRLAPEGYVPLTPAERDGFPARMACVSCGLCALASRTSPVSAWEEAWTFVTGPSRSIDAARESAASIGEAAREDGGARVCPTGVPIPLLAASLERLAAEQQRWPDER